MKIEIKAARVTDIGAINDLLYYSKGSWGYDKEFLDHYMQKYSITVEYINQHVVRVLWINEKIAGFYCFIFHQDGSLELEKFYLHPDYFGQSLGRRLWQSCCKTAQQLGASEFIIWSDPHSEGFYEKMGCVKIGKRKSPLMLDRYPVIFKYTLPAM